MKEIYYLMIGSISPQTFWHLRTDDVNPCDTALLPHHQPIRELCTSWSHTPWPSPLTWPLKVLCRNPLRSWGLFGHEPPVLLAWPCSKPFSALNSVSVCLASLCIRHSNLRLVPPPADSSGFGWAQAWVILKASIREFSVQPGLRTAAVGGTALLRKVRDTRPQQVRKGAGSQDPGEEA